MLNILKGASSYAFPASPSLRALPKQSYNSGSPPAKRKASGAVIFVTITISTPTPSIYMGISKRGLMGFVPKMLAATGKTTSHSILATLFRYTARAAH